jgi:hypothetical protein
MGEEITDFQRFALPRAKQADAGVQGVVLRIDSFGNAMTNLRAEDLPDTAQNGNFKLTVGNHAVSRLVDTFASGTADEPFAYLGSSGYLEIGLNKASAARKLGIGRGNPVVLAKN